MLALFCASATGFEERPGNELWGCQSPISIG